jgi:transposase
MSAMLKSFDPDAQVARDERISAERFMRMQLFDLKDRLKRTEDELKAANTTIERLRRKISKLETEKLMAQLEARLCYGGVWFAAVSLRYRYGTKKEIGREVFACDGNVILF